MNVEGFRSARSREKKAVIIAEAIFALLSEQTALAARRCVVLHWFDQFLVEALLGDTELTLDEMGNICEQLRALPFIETLPWGLAFQSVIREGLIKEYSATQPELLRIAASLAAPAYETREEDKQSRAEAFFCYTVAAEREAAIELQHILFEKASSQHDWSFLDSLLSLQNEAERFAFVQPLPVNEQDFLLRGFVHRIQRRNSLALLSYNQALELNPRSPLVYVSRGAMYTEQEAYEEALSDYRRAVRIDRKYAPAYLDRGIVYTRQGKHKAALKEIEKAIQLGIKTDHVFIKKGDILRTQGNDEEALDAYTTALGYNQDSAEALIGQGQTLNDLGIGYYEKALQAFEHVLTLSPHRVDAYIGKGHALNGLECYEKVLKICSLAFDLNCSSAEVYRIQARALRGLYRYAEASEALKKANEPDSLLTQEGVVSDNAEKQTHHTQERFFGVGKQKTSIFLRNAPKVLRPRKKEQQKG